MSNLDSEDLPPELSYVADQLRSHRYEASPLELDQTKTRILKRVDGRRAARGRGMPKRSLLTALIMFAAIGTGSAAALAVGGVSLPIIGSPAKSAAPHASAAIAVYGSHPSTTSVRCVIVNAVTRTIKCKATVTGATHPGGTISWASNVGGTFTTNTCTLTLDGGNQASCSVTFTSNHSGDVKIYANYSGDVTNAPSHGSTTITLTAPTPSTTAISCTTASFGNPSTCTATVTGSIHPSGTVVFHSNVGGTFSPSTCTLVDIGGNQARCSVSFTSNHAGSVKVYGNYSGDANNTPSKGNTIYPVV
jgi:hypothetical protein